MRRLRFGTRRELEVTFDADLNLMMASFDPFRFLTARALAAGLLVGVCVGACTSAVANDIEGPFQAVSPSGDAASDAASALTYDVSVDANAAAPSLCKNIATCDPDHDLQSQLSACGVPLPIDAGYDDDAGLVACRVTATAAECARAGTGANGAACMTGADCQAGYECVNSPGRCRHYCCDQSACKTVSTSANEDTFFCDIQSQTAALPIKVPVCTPVQACKLLGKTCGDGRTCGIVDALEGTTSCIDIGLAAVGESCELEHCAANLSCLGSAGKRTCQKICDPTDSASCPAPETCKQPWTVLKTDSAGICQ